jgi:hypothetical protein
LVGAENDRPSLEVRFRSDGHPPFTEREREIHLNGTGGVIFRNPDRKFDPGFFVEESKDVSGGTHALFASSL